MAERSGARGGLLELRVIKVDGLRVAEFEGSGLEDRPTLLVGVDAGGVADPGSGGLFEDHARQGLSDGASPGPAESDSGFIKLGRLSIGAELGGVERCADCRCCPSSD